MKYIHSIIIIFFFAGLTSCTDELSNDPIGLLTIDQVDSDPTIATIDLQLAHHIYLLKIP